MRRKIRPIFLADALSSVVLAAVVWRWCPRPLGFGRPASYSGLGVQNRRMLSALRANRLVVAVLLSVIAVDTADRQYYVALPLQLRDLGERPLVYGLLLTANCVVLVLFEVQLAMRLARHRAAPGTGSHRARCGCVPPPCRSRRARPSPAQRRDIRPSPAGSRRRESGVDAGGR